MVPVSALVLAAALAAPDPRLDVLSAMTAELARSAERLRLTGYDAPYFVSYQVKEVAKSELEGRYGAVFDDALKRDRNLFVDVRVGSYELDSSGPEQQVIVLDGGDGPSWYAPKDAPLDGDTAALRNALWLATDERYKEALSTYFKKRSREVYRDEPDRAPSFSREAPVRHVDPPRPFPLDRERWKAIVREASAMFRDHPEIFDSSVKLVAEKQVRWFASSEGTALVTEHTIYGLHATAVTRAPDGQLLDDSWDVYAPTEVELPGREAVLLG